MNEKTARAIGALRKLGVLPADSRPTDLASLLNESQQLINAWSDRGISIDGANKIQKLFGVDTNWVSSGEGAMFINEKILSKAIKNFTDHSYHVEKEIILNQYEIGGSMGNGLELRDQPGVIHSWSVSPEWLQKNVPGYASKNGLCIVTGFGDSMQPMFNPGDPLIVDTSVNSVEFDAVYFFRVGNEGFIKRLQRIPGQGIAAISENKSYRDWTITETMDFQVFGRVLKAWESKSF